MVPIQLTGPDPLAGCAPLPIGLTMIVLSGADLFTSNVMFMGTAFLHRRISLYDLMRSWVISFLGNLAGMLFFVTIITGYGDVFGEEAYRTEIFNFATQKMLVPQWHQIMLRAIGANWLVCFAVFISISSREVNSKIIAIWLPTATFVGLGLDHVVANMFFIPTAIFYGHPDIGVGLYIWKSMIPTAIGNIIGGFVFMALPYWYLYLTGIGGDVQIHFDLGTVATAIEVGGPMDNASEGQPRGRGVRPSPVAVTALDGVSPPAVISPAKKDGTSDSDISLPDSGSRARSALSQELCAEKYAKRKDSTSGSPDQAV